MTTDKTWWQKYGWYVTLIFFTASITSLLSVWVFSFLLGINPFVAFDIGLKTTLKLQPQNWTCIEWKNETKYYAGTSEVIVSEDCLSKCGNCASIGRPNAYFIKEECQWDKVKFLGRETSNLIDKATSSSCLREGLDCFEVRNCYTNCVIEGIDVGNCCFDEPLTKTVCDQYRSV